MSKILVVVDMQKDFVDGSLGTAEAQAIVPEVHKKILEYKNSGFGIIATKDTHYEGNYSNTQEGRNLPILHCIKDTEGWELVPEIRELINPRDIFLKTSFGSIEAMQKVAQLTKEDFIEYVEFVGLCTDICVISNVILFKAFAPEVKVVVDSKCCAGVTPKKHNDTLEVMRSIQVEVR